MVYYLPDDVWKHGFEYLETTDAFVAAQVCQHWSTLLKEIPCLWRICRVAVENNLVWPTREPPPRAGVLTRGQKRFRESTVSVPAVLRSVGRFLFRLTIGSYDGWCDLTLQNQHLQAVARACPLLQKLKLYVTATSPDLCMSALNDVVARCANLHMLALPVNGGAVIMDEEPVRYNSIRRVKLHGELTWTPTQAPQTWMMRSIVALQLIHVSNLDHMHLIQHCTNLRHLVLDSCESTQPHPLHIGPDMDAFEWMFDVAKRLHTFGLVRSSTVMCVCYLLSTLTMAVGGAADTPWNKLNTLWLDANPSDHNMNLTVMFSCVDCTAYSVYKSSVATELNRCASCRTRAISNLETVYLVH